MDFTMLFYGYTNCEFRKGGAYRTNVDSILIIILVSVAVISDLKTWRIPNWLVLIGIATGCFVSILERSFLNGIKHGIVGITIPVVVLVVLFLIKSIGAGDIKLLSAVGSFVGKDVGLIILYSFIFSGILAICYIIRNQIFSAVFHGKLSGTGRIKGATGSEEQEEVHKVHFSIAILMSVLFYLVKG
jgi:prepilin peptidase CpaA